MVGRRRTGGGSLPSSSIPRGEAERGGGGRNVLKFSCLSLSLSFALSENYPGKQCLGRGETPPRLRKCSIPWCCRGRRKEISLLLLQNNRSGAGGKRERKRGFCETIELPSTKAESGSPSSRNTRTRVTTTAEREKEKERGERIGRLLLLLHKGEGGE